MSEEKKKLTGWRKWVVENVNPKFTRYNKPVTVALVVGFLTYVVVFIGAFFIHKDCSTESLTITFDDYYTYNYAVVEGANDGIGAPWDESKCIQRWSFFDADAIQEMINSQTRLVKGPCDGRQALVDAGSKTTFCGSHSYHDDYDNMFTCDAPNGRSSITASIIMAYDKETCTPLSVSIGAALGYAFLAEFLFTLLIVGIMRQFFGLEGNAHVTMDFLKSEAFQSYVKGKAEGVVNDL